MVLNLIKKHIKHWLKLKQYVLNNGYEIDAESCYRSYDYQTKILQKLITEKGSEYTYKVVALLGHSAHQAGLAIDYCVIEDGKYLIETNLYDNEVCQFTNSVAHKDGFIIRYSKGKEDIIMNRGI